MILTIIALMILIPLVVVISKKVKKAIQSSPTRLALIAYENFGHNFDIESTVNSTLKKVPKPPGTIFAWETKESEKGSDKNIIEIVLKDFSENSVKETISLNTYVDSDYYRTRSEWSSFYAQDQKSVEIQRNVFVTPQEYFERKIKHMAVNMCHSYKVKFPGEFSGEKKFGTV